jgi:hypothetical protein
MHFQPVVILLGNVRVISIVLSHHVGDLYWLDVKHMPNWLSPGYSSYCEEALGKSGNLWSVWGW